MLQKNLLCVTQFHFPYMKFSIHYSFQYLIVLQQNRWPYVTMLPLHVIYVSKIFLKPKSIKNLPMSTTTQIHAWNIAEAATIIRHMSQVSSNETQYVDDMLWVQLMITSNLSGNYKC